MPSTTIGNPALWIGFNAFVVAMLALDLGVFNRKAHVVGYKEALIWSGVWISLALTFNAGLAWQFGGEHGLEFLTGYLIEKSLSVDNIFVFIVVFSAMKVPPAYQHRVLFWGIFSALLLRAAMIFAGAALLARFHWLFYIFGAFLVFTGIKLFIQRNKEEHPEDSAVMRIARRVIPSTPNYDKHHFFTRENGKLLATPLFMALLIVEITDVVFAVDSIPAVFAVTEDPFIVYTSNIFAILGLRSLFLLLSGVMEKFRYLKVGLTAVLVFVGGKMMIADIFHIPALVSLVVIIVIMGAAAVASVVVGRRAPAQPSGLPHEQQIDRVV
jgi:tellurite resistance protein TerC